MGKSERQPLSGKIIGTVYERYKKQRGKIGPPTVSASEPVLEPMIAKGIIGGFGEALQRIDEVIGDEFISGLTPREKRAVRVIFIVVGGAEYGLITVGLRSKVIVREDGHWKLMAPILKRLDPEE